MITASRWGATDFYYWVEVSVTHRYFTRARAILQQESFQPQILVFSEVLALSLRLNINVIFGVSFHGSFKFYLLRKQSSVSSGFLVGTGERSRKLRFSHCSEGQVDFGLMTW